MNWITFLYPRAWRERYGEEFSALLEDAPPGWTGVVEIAWEALKMHFELMNRRAFAGCVVAGLAVAAFVAYRTPDKFASSAVLRLSGSADVDPEALTSEGAKLLRELLSRTSLSNLMQKPGLDLYKTERQRMPLEDVIQKMKDEDLRVSVLPEKPGSKEFAIHIAYNGPDPKRAQDVVETLVRRLIDEHQNSQHMTALRLARQELTDADAKTAALGTRLEVLDPASHPKTGISPNRPAIILAGLFAGIVAFFVVSGVRRHVWATVAGAVASFATWVLVVLYLPHQYVSTSLLQTDSSATVQSFVTNRELLAIIRDAAVTQAAPGSVKPGDIRVEATPEPRGLRIAVRSYDRFAAQRANQTTISGLVEHEARRRMAQGLPVRGPVTPWVEVVDPPSLPVRPDTPTFVLPLPWWIVLAGFALGAGTVARLRHNRPVPIT